MQSRIYPYDDFEAMIHIFSFEEGGRRSPAYNGIRWDFEYADRAPEEEELFMIWPDFLDKNGNSLPKDKPLPTGVEIPARMYVLIDERRKEVHRAKIGPGVKFFCREGGKRTAAGTITKITGLFEPRKPE